MNTKLNLAMLALVISAVPASAQISTTDRVRDRVILGGDRAGTQTRRDGTIGDIIFGRTDTRDDRSRSKVPKGHLPPRGMCRVWIDGVPPGQQPAPTSCSQAQRDRVQYGANARVIYGDDESFPGKGKGKFKNADRETTDVFGRRIERDRDDDDDDRWDDDDKDRRKQAAKANKGRGKGKKG